MRSGIPVSTAKTIVYSEPGLVRACPTELKGTCLTVRVPATSANVGVGFDVMGIALDLVATFTFHVCDGLCVYGCLPEYCNDNNLVWTSYLTACEMLDVQPRTLAIGIDSPLPLSGGLGSSSTCVVAGVVAAQLLSGRPFDRPLALNMATSIEGHPDNVAPAVYGGLTSSFVEAGTTHAAIMPVGDNLRFVAMAPPYEVLTEEARKALPSTVGRDVAVWQMGRCVAMADALVRGDANLIALACHDKLHEPHRMRLIPDYDLLRTRCLQAGACAFVISGSGSCMLAIVDGDERTNEVLRAIAHTVNGMWVRTLRALPEGTTVRIDS